MKSHNNSIFLLVLVLVVGINFSASAQFNDYTAKFGIQINALLPDTEFDKELRPDNADYKLAYLGRALVRFEFFTEVLEVEIGAGFGQLQGVDFNNELWRTNLIPVDLRLILSPFDMDVWNPYAYGGVGGLCGRYSQCAQKLGLETFHSILQRLGMIGLLLVRLHEAAQDFFFCLFVEYRLLQIFACESRPLPYLRLACSGSAVFCQKSCLI